LIPTEQLFNEDYKVVEGNNRHEALLRVMESLLSRNGNILALDKIKDLASDWNNKHCFPPLNDNEFQKQWKCAAKFVSNGNKGKDSTKGSKSKYTGYIISAATESIINRHTFLTLEESKEILYYDSGVYVQGGEVIIEKSAENLFGYRLANRHLAEIKGHIMRRTYHKHSELDSDVNIINLKNGLYNIPTGEFKQHTPDHLSVSQKPILYNQAAKAKLFGTYLSQVLYPLEIRTAVEVMAYTLYRENPFEIISKLFGYGANGKSVFTGLLTAIHGVKGTSNVPLSSMLKDEFALSDLEDKCVNIDTELSAANIRDTAILKKLTGRQPTRIQRKHQRAYDTLMYAKLFFSANKIPETEDNSDAYFRRVIIISFPNRFEDGRGADPNLLKKLTTEEEMSGILNILLPALRRLLKKGIFVIEKTIEQRREKHELAVDPIGCFVREAVSEDSVESDRTTKESLYRAYKCFCNKHSLAIESKENLGKILKNKHNFQDGRESTGERRTVWKGLKLCATYNLEEEQQMIL
jgi:putative DNA primase/helicase